MRIRPGYMTRGLVLIFIVGLLFAAVGCSLFNTDKVPTPQEKALFFVSTWNRQFDDTAAMAARANLTDAQKKVVKAKKDLLARSKPLIAAYVDLVALGEVPPAATEAAIYEILNQLATVTGG